MYHGESGRIVTIVSRKRAWWSTIRRKSVSYTSVIASTVPSRKELSRKDESRRKVDIGGTAGCGEGRTEIGGIDGNYRVEQFIEGYTY